MQAMLSVKLICVGLHGLCQVASPQAELIRQDHMVACKLMTRACQIRICPLDDAHFGSHCGAHIASSTGQIAGLGFSVHSIQVGLWTASAKQEHFAFDAKQLVWVCKPYLPSRSISSSPDPRQSTSAAVGDHSSFT